MGAAVVLAAVAVECGPAAVAVGLVVVPDLPVGSVVVVGGGARPAGGFSGGGGYGGGARPNIGSSPSFNRPSTPTRTPSSPLGDGGLRNNAAGAG